MTSLSEFRGRQAPRLHLNGRWAARALGWTLLLGTTGLLLGSERTTSTAITGVVTRSELRYRNGGSSRQKLDLYIPAGEKPPSGWPVVLALHGGGWRGGSKADFGRIVGRLAQGGVAVASADYELSRPGEPSWPANLEDVREAVRWLRTESTTFGLDSSRIAALGASAGGHLAALLGTMPGDESSRVDAVVALYAPMELTTLSPACLASGGPVDLLLGGRGDQVAATAAAASPLHHVTPDDAPMLLIHGDQDNLIPPDQSERMAAALERAGVSHRLIEVEGAGHAFGIEVNGHDLAPSLLEFLESTWKDKKDKH